MIQSTRCKWHPEEKYKHDDFLTKKMCMGEAILVDVPDSLTHKCVDCGKEYEESWLAGLCFYTHHSTAIRSSGEGK